VYHNALNYKRNPIGDEQVQAYVWPGFTKRIVSRTWSHAAKLVQNTYF